MEIAEFISARLAEDQKAARGLATRLVASYGVGGPAAAAFWNRFDEDRARREIAFKRAVLADHEPYDCGEPPVPRCRRCASDDAYPSGVAVMEAFPCTTLRQLASVWNEHPDYRAEWAPDSRE